ncbi:MAG: hypothetical protein ABEJ66_01560 [Candidatus Nanohaloarchaea archaeon]
MGDAELGDKVQETHEQIRQKLLEEQPDLSHLTEQDYINHIIFREMEKLVHEGKLSAEDVNLQI